MEIKNQQIFTCGEGKQRFQIYFTVDLIPVSVVFKYDFIERQSKGWNLITGELEDRIAYEEPKLISDIFTKDVFQQIIDLVCERLNIEERKVICLTENRIANQFNFSKDDYFYEYLFEGTFGRAYYLETKIHHALKYWDQFQKLGERRIKGEFFLDDVDEIDRDFYRQFYKVKRSIDLQGVFNNRDHHYISQKTMDNFIKNLSKKKSVI
jgi:hypothetical protein